MFINHLLTGMILQAVSGLGEAMVQGDTQRNNEDVPCDWQKSLGHSDETLRFLRLKTCTTKMVVKILLVPNGLPFYLVAAPSSTSSSLPFSTSAEEMGFHGSFLGLRSSTSPPWVESPFLGLSYQSCERTGENLGVVIC